MIVNLYHLGQAISNLNSKYGVLEVTIYKWIKELSPAEHEDGSSIIPEALQKIMQNYKNKCLR